MLLACKRLHCSLYNVFWNCVDRSFVFALIFIRTGLVRLQPWLGSPLCWGQKKAWPPTQKTPWNKLLVSVILAVEATFWLFMTERLFRYRFWIFIQVCSSIRVCQHGSRRRAGAGVWSWWAMPLSCEVSWAQRCLAACAGGKQHVYGRVSPLMLCVCCSLWPESTVNNQ